MVDTTVDGIDIRSAVPIGKSTVRTRITDLMLDALDAAPFDEDAPDGAKLFDIGKRGNLEDISMRETPAYALEEGDESVDELIYEHTQKKMRVYVNFKVVRVQGVDPTDVINYYFARIVKLFVTVDRHFAGLALDIAEAGNSIQANGLSDPEPGGTVFLDVDYRHVRGDLLTER